MEGMRHDGETALSVNEVNCTSRRQTWRDAFLEVQADEVAVQRADLFADDDVDTELRVGPGETIGFEGAPDFVMIRNGQDVQMSSGRANESIRPLCAIAPRRVHMEIGTTGAEAASTPTRWHAPQARSSNNASERRERRSGHL
jgi:hypothetical protein